MRVGIVNDQRLATEALRAIVSSDPNHQVVWTAVDGCEAVRKCREDLPDVVIMDLVMPVMDGAEATRRIMQSTPCPVLVVTATVSGNYALVCQAMGHGAYDAICTPSLGDREPGVAGAYLLAKLDAVNRIGRDERADGSGPGLARTHRLPGAASRMADGPLVVIGCSTGGPQALEKIISSWPANFPAAVVVVQHIAADFAASLVQWLQHRSRLEVRPIVAGDSPRPGCVWIAATDDHLVMRSDRRLGYRTQPASSPYRPSVDVMFGSLAENWPMPSVAVVLTGIGRDGADGLLKLRQQGWHTIAQDEKSSVVYGMPQAATALGAAKRILPLDEMASHIANHLARRN